MHRLFFTPKGFRPRNSGELQCINSPSMNSAALKWLGREQGRGTVLANRSSPAHQSTNSGKPRGSSGLSCADQFVMRRRTKRAAVRCDSMDTMCS